MTYLSYLSCADVESYDWDSVDEAKRVGLQMNENTNNGSKEFTNNNRQYKYRDQHFKRTVNLKRLLNCHIFWGTTFP